MTLRRRMRRDLERDIQEHIEMETRDNLERGMSPEEARYAALRKFGNVTLVQEQTRAAWGWTRLERLGQDARYALRAMHRNPVFTMIAVLTLALGIGMNTAVFSVVNAVLIAPIPYPNPDRLVWLATYNQVFKMEAVAGPDFLDWRDQAQSFEAMMAYGFSDNTIAIGENSDKVTLAYPTAELWAITGAQPALGRFFSASDRDVLVLTHALFERRFGSDPGAIGKTVMLDGRPATIIGVLPREFRFVPQSIGAPGFDAKEIEAYAPSTISRANQTRAGGMAILFTIAKLKPGVTVERARAEMATIQGRIARQSPGGGFYQHSEMRVEPLQEKLVHPARRALLTLLGAVAFVLLIACANLGNLLLSRAASRQREIAIRAAVGAGRGRLLEQFLTEGVILALAGGAAGLVLARAAIGLMMRLGPHAVPRLDETTIDLRVLGFTLGISVAAGILFGLAPAFSLSRATLHDVLKQGGRIAGARPSGIRIRAVLVAGELALALVLLAGAGLLIKSFWRMNAHPAGFEPEKIAVMKLSLSGPNYRAQEAQIAYLRQALARLQSAPGVVSSAITNTARYGIVNVEGAPPFSPGQEVYATYRAVSAGYWKTLGIRLVKGRWLADEEPAEVIMINETLARRLFGNGDPIGHRIRIQRPRPLPMATIVGVSADLEFSHLGAEAAPEIYIPYQQAPSIRSQDVVIKTTGDPAAVTQSLRKLIAEVDPSQPVFEAQTLEHVLSESIAPRRFNLFLLGTFAGAAVLLALVGIYGVISYGVTQRTHEIGVRMALGARRGDVVLMVIRQGMGIALAGVAVGVVSALGLTRVIAGWLYEVEPADPATFTVVAGTLAATALVSSWGPALKAALVDPIIALRCD